jgi:hypothetical protein
MAREIEAEEEDTPAPKGDAGEKLKLVAHYAMLGFAPVVSVIALGVALFATGNHSDRAQISELNSRIEKLNASLSASREELENLKFSISREKSQRADERKDERKKEEEHDAKIVQSITRLQEKLKIVPTLEEQLRAPTGARADASPVAGTAAIPASAPAAADKKQAAADVAVPAKKAEEKKKPAPPPKPAEKLSPQVKAIKDAIEQYNKQ